MSRPSEIELKLELDHADAERLRQLPPLRHQPAGGRRQLRSVYFDTPKHLLAKAGVSLRIRTVDGRHVQTIKTQGAGAGLFDRGEWECEVQKPVPDLAAARDSALGALARRRAVRKNLRPVFETVVDRTLWHMSRDGSDIEVALDEGETRAGQRVKPICALELELKRGPAAALFAVARSYGDAVPLRLAVESKSDQGYALLARRRPRVSKAEPVRLDADMTAAEGFQAILRACIRHFRLNEPVLLQERDIEALHQMRVAIRRLRSALSLFRDMVEDDAFEGLRTRLQQVSRELGEARNIDVFLARTRRLAAENPEALKLAERGRAERDAAYDRVVATLDSREFRRLMLELSEWIGHGAWTTAAGREAAALRETRLLDFAGDMLQAWRRKVRNKGRHLDELEAEERHRVRIAAKKLRYASEFFASLYQDKKARKRHGAFVDALQNLQEQLGELNDIEAGRQLAESLAHEAPGPGHEEDVEAALAAGLTASAAQTDIDALLHAAAKAYDDFVEAEPFWR